MNKEYLPFYNSLNEKEKTFWLDCSKEALIDHLIANINNGEKLLNRINEAIDYIKNHSNNCMFELRIEEMEELLEILGDKKDE